MLYLTRPSTPHGPETARALQAADGYVYLGLLDEALAELAGISEVEQQDVAVLLARIRLLLHKRDWVAAEKLSRRSMAAHPNEGEFTVQRAFALHQMRRAERAAAVLLEAPHWLRRTGILHYNLACYEARLGDLTAARQCIDAAIQINASIKKNARLDPDLKALWN